MAFKTIKNLAGKSLVSLLSLAFFNQSCNICKTIPHASLESIPSIVTENKIPIDTSINYKNLSWEEAIDCVKTPEQAQNYLDKHLTFVKTFKTAPHESFKLNHLNGKGVCVNYALDAAALLQDNGYLPLILGFKSKKDDYHAIFLYRTEKGFSALGNTSVDKSYKSIDELVEDFHNLYDYEPTGYFVMNLDKNFQSLEKTPIGPKEWITGDNLENKRISFWSYTKIKKDNSENKLSDF